MNGRAVSLTIVAFLLGALAAGGVSVRVIREVSTAADATSLPRANIAPDEAASVDTQVDGNPAAFPIRLPFSVSETDPVSDIGFGYTVELLQVLDGAETTIVQVLVTNSDPSAAGLRLSGSGPGWSAAGGAADLGEPASLVWTDGTLPLEIRLNAIGAVWVPTDGGLSASPDGES